MCRLITNFSRPMCERKCLLADYKTGKREFVILYIYFIFFHFNQEIQIHQTKDVFWSYTRTQTKSSDENFWPVIIIIAFLIHKHMMNTIKLWYSKISKLPNPARHTHSTHTQVKNLKLVCFIDSWYRSPPLDHDPCESLQPLHCCLLLYCKEWCVM